VSAEPARERLSQISTLWSALVEAHGGAEAARLAAQRQLIERYAGAVHRYLQGILRDPHAADELQQEFLLALIRGEFHKADREKGRFREYVKGVLFHLVSKHRRGQGRRPQVLAADSPVWHELADGESEDASFESSLREELMARTWEALARSHVTLHEVLRLRAEYPKLPSEELAKRLGHQLDRPFSADAVRQLLRRARALFSDLLLDEVAGSLGCPERDDLERELADLSLFSYCQDALARRFPSC
jgi:RNA polymerase sigma-70 factor (ECF subfamily)